MTIAPPIGWAEAGRRLWRRAPRWRLTLVFASLFSFLTVHYTFGPATLPQRVSAVFQQTDLRPGETVRRLITIGGKTIPLPTGDWAVLAVLKAPRSNRVDDITIENVALARGAMPNLTGLIFVTANTNPASQGFRADGECERSDLNYTDVTSNIDFGQQDCRVIDFFNMRELLKQHPGDILGGAAMALAAEHWTVPSTMIGASFRFGNQQQLLLAQYLFNPDEEGITPTRNPAWSESDWNKYNIARFPEKQAYIERITVWMRQWYIFVKTGFDGKLPNDTGLTSDPGP